MGLKYIESIKSLILLLLVSLSVVLSFSIWNFMPGYETIDKQPTVDISIAAPKRIDEIVKPYKMIFNFEDHMRGTENSIEIDRVFESVKQLSIEELTLSQKMSVETINETLRKPNQIIFFYPSGVPFKVLDTILKIEDSNIPEESFTKMVINWSQVDNNQLQLYFLNDKENLAYVAKAHGIDRNRLSERFLTNAMDYDLYTEIQRENSLSLYVGEEPLEDDLMAYTYFFSQVNPDDFKKALFPDPNVVRGNSVTLSTEEYLDDSSKLTLDTINKSLSYVNPGEESKTISIPSELIFDSIDFVNEHGGFTDDYRYSSIDAINKGISFRLHIYGYPAFSDSKMMTEIKEVWGENEIFRYNRPYYDLGSPFPSENHVFPLPSGKTVADVLATIREVDFQSVEEIRAGYNLSITQRQEQRLIIAEPSYYYSINGNWQRVTQEMLGGGSLGLE